MDGARNPDAMRVALSGLDQGRISLADFSRVAADNQIFEGWVDKMKARFRAAVPPAPRPPASMNQAAATPPPAPAPAPAPAGPAPRTRAAA